MNSGILHLFLEIVVIGLVVWLINAYLPIPEPFKKIILVIGVIVAVVLAFGAFGVHF